MSVERGSPPAALPTGTAPTTPTAAVRPIEEDDVTTPLPSPMGVASVAGSSCRKRPRPPLLRSPTASSRSPRRPPTTPTGRGRMARPRTETPAADTSDTAAAAARIADAGPTGSATTTADAGGGGGTAALPCATFQCWLCGTQSATHDRQGRCNRRKVTSEWRLLLCLVAMAFPPGVQDRYLTLCKSCHRSTTSTTPNCATDVLQPLRSCIVRFDLAEAEAAAHGLGASIKKSIVRFIKACNGASPASYLQPFLLRLALPVGVEVVPAAPGNTVIVCVDGGSRHSARPTASQQAFTFVEVTRTLTSDSSGRGVVSSIFVKDAVGSLCEVLYGAICHPASIDQLVNFSTLPQQQQDPGAVYARLLREEALAEDSSRRAAAAAERAAAAEAAAAAAQSRNSHQAAELASAREEVTRLRETDGQLREAQGEVASLKRKVAPVVAARKEAAAAVVAAAVAERGREGAEAEAKRLLQQVTQQATQHGADLDSANSGVEKQRVAADSAVERLSAQRKKTAGVVECRDAAKSELAAIKKDAAALKSANEVLQKKFEELGTQVDEQRKELSRVRAQNSRLTASAPSVATRGGTRSGISAMTAVQAAVSAGVTDRGAAAVAGEVLDILEEAIIEVFGERLSPLVRKAANEYASAEASNGKSWRELWDQFPWQLTKLLMAIAGRSGREERRFTTLFAMASMFMNLSNPQCNHITQRPISTLSSSGIGGRAAMSSVLKAFSLAVSSYTAHHDHNAQSEAGEEWVRLVVALAASLGCVLFVVFDNIDWDMGRADQAIHMLLSIVCIGDPAECGAVSKLRCEVTVEDLCDKTAMEEGTASAARERRRQRALVLGETTRIRTEALCAGDAAANLERAAELGRSEAQRRKRGRKAGQRDGEGEGMVEELASVECKWAYTAPPSSGDILRGVSVVCGEALENVQLLREVKLAVFRNNDGGKFGYIPLRCVTGKEEDIRPARFGAGITTPVAEQKRLRGRHITTTTTTTDTSDDTANREYLSFLTTTLGEDSDSSGGDHIGSDGDAGGSDAASSPTASLDGSAASGDADATPGEARRLQMLDEQLRQACAEAQKKNNGCAPPRPESSAVLSLTDERASDYAGVARSIEANIAKLKGAMAELEVEATVLFACDAQPWKLISDELDRKRRLLVARRLPLAQKRSAGGVDDAALNAAIAKIDSQLRELDLEVEVVLGWFHGTMTSIRGLAKTHSDLQLRGLFSHAGLVEAVVVKALECASGYYKFTIDLLDAAFAAWCIEEAAMVGRLGLEEHQVEPLRGKVPSWNLHHLAAEDTVSVLNLDEASKLRGRAAHDLKVASIKDCLLIFGSGACYNYLVHAPQDLCFSLVASSAVIGAMRTNATLPRRRNDDLGTCDASSSYPDETIETDGVGMTKQNVDPQPTTVTADTMAMNATPGVVGGVLQETGSSRFLSVVAGRRMTIDHGEAIARMRVALRVNVMTAVEQHARAVQRGEDVGLLRIPAVPLLGGAQDTSAVENEEYVLHLRENQRRIAQDACKRPIAVETGGSVAGVPRSRLNHKRLTLYIEDKQQQARTVKAKASRMQAALGMFMSGDKEAARLLLSVVKVDGGHVGLRHSSAKSGDRKALRKLCRGAFAYSASGDLIHGSSDIGVNIMVKDEGEEAVVLTAVALDGNQYFRNLPPHVSTANPTGLSVLVAFLRQTSSRTTGFRDVFVVFDVGGDPLKMMEESSRDKNGASAVGRGSFHEGDLGKQTRDYLQKLYRDRSSGGGRDQIYAIFHKLLTAPWPTWDTTLADVMRKLCAGGASFGICGIGNTAEQKLVLHTYTGHSSTFAIQRKEESSGRQNREDSEAFAVLYDKALSKSLNACLYGFDQDFVSIALIGYARAERKNIPHLGRLFVRQKEQSVDGKSEEYVDTSLLYAALESDDETTNRLAPQQGLVNFHRTLPKGRRALSVVVASMALGRDSSPGIPGVSHVNGIARYVELSGWVGPLIRAANEEEKRDGREIVVDKDALSRFQLLQQVGKYPSRFCVRYKALGVPEKARELERLNYVEAEKLVAEAVIPNIVDLMPARIDGDPGSCVVTAIMRLLTDQLTVWDAAVVAHPMQIRYWGIVATVTNSEGGEKVIVAPTMSELDSAASVLKVLPSFPVGENGLPQNPRPMGFYFGGDGLGNALVRNLKITAESEKRKAKQKPKELCDTCYHPHHEDGHCDECGGDCKPHCKKCLHAEHGGSFCAECIKKPGSFAKCNYRCGQCRHEGAFSGHKKNGCSSCGEACGCNLLRPKKRQAAAEEAKGAEAGGGGNDGDDDDEDGEDDDEGQDGLEEVLRSAEGAGFAAGLDEAVALVAGSEDDDLGDIVAEGHR